MTDETVRRRPWAGRAADAAAPLATLAGAVAAFGYIGAVDPNEPGHYPVCPVLHYTGLYCPGCGGLRSAHALAHGDLATAIGANALAVAGFLVLAAVWALWLVRAVGGRPPKPRLRPPVRPAHVWAVLVALALLFTAVRNAPLGAGLAP
ncbi:DUF2752 domain-containing protein [Streptomyces sp. KR80]|uniref:DUF2752 domain-containing protein n=1 Tax=Streptomyces sp. KR80 TaxID=3457426 RepID=UPI003FD3DB5C